jgi:ketosteroid isomerase-like protein
MNTEQTLFELASDREAKRWELMLNADTDALADLLSDDLQFIHASGLKDSKEPYLEAIRAGTVTYRSASSRIETVTCLGDHAFIASGVVDMQATVRGIDRDLHSLFTVVWRREQSAWRLVSHQTTAAAQ